MTQAFLKRMKNVEFTEVIKNQKRQRLPLVDFIGLKPIFMVKNRHQPEAKVEVSQIALLNYRNNLTYAPDSPAGLRA